MQPFRQVAFEELGAASSVAFGPSAAAEKFNVTELGVLSAVLSAGDVRSENAGGSNNSSSMQVSLLGAIGAASGAVARAANAARNRAA